MRYSEMYHQNISKQRKRDNHDQEKTINFKIWTEKEIKYFFIQGTPSAVSVSKALFKCQ